MDCSPSPGKSVGWYGLVSGYPMQIHHLRSTVRRLPPLRRTTSHRLDGTAWVMIAFAPGAIRQLKDHERSCEIKSQYWNMISWPLHLQRQKDYCYWALVPSDVQAIFKGPFLRGGPVCTWGKASPCGLMDRLTPLSKLNVHYIDLSKCSAECSSKPCEHIIRVSWTSWMSFVEHSVRKALRSQKLRRSLAKKSKMSNNQTGYCCTILVVI